MIHWTQAAIAANLDRMTLGQGLIRPLGVEKHKRDIIRLDEPVSSRAGLVRQIIAETAFLTKISVLDIKSYRRHPSIVRARQMAIYVIRMSTDHSLPAIGRMVGRDHSTIIHSVLSVEAKRARYEPELTLLLNKFRREDT